MNHKCDQHGVFFSEGFIWKCKYCRKNLKFYCIPCKSWYWCTFRTKHELTDKHKKNLCVIVEETKENPDLLTLFTFLKGKTWETTLQKNNTVADLKESILSGMSPPLNCNSYFMTTLNGNYLCMEDEDLSKHFENFAFFVLNEKTLFDEKFDTLVHFTKNLSLNDEIKSPSLNGETTPLLQQHKNKQ
jgi:hypothetical protein